MIPPWRSRARWWLTAGWLWLSWSHRAPTWRSPSERMRITWRRVGSLTCFRRIDARRACWNRLLASFCARVLLGVAFGVTATCLGLVFVAISRELLPRDESIGA